MTPSLKTWTPAGLILMPLAVLMTEEAFVAVVTLVRLLTLVRVYVVW